jgi:hypothetical protein
MGNAAATRTARCNSSSTGTGRTPAKPPPEDRAVGLRRECEHVRDRLGLRRRATGKAADNEVADNEAADNEAADKGGRSCEIGRATGNLLRMIKTAFSNSR